MKENILFYTSIKCSSTLSNKIRTEAAKGSIKVSSYWSYRKATKVSNALPLELLIVGGSKYAAQQTHACYAFGRSGNSNSTTIHYSKWLKL